MGTDRVPSSCALYFFLVLAAALAAVGCRADRILYEYRTRGDNIWIVPITGGASDGGPTPERLTYSGPCLCPDFSRSDSIAFTAPIDHETTIGLQVGVGIWVMPGAGGRASLVCAVEDTTIDYYLAVEYGFPPPAPRWSKDGRRIVYAYRGWIYSFEPFITQAVQPIYNLSNEAHLDLAPAFAPDMSSIAFYRSADDSTYHLWTADLQAPTLIAEIFTSQAYHLRSGVYPRLDWSPNGGRLVFQAEGGIWIVNVESREAVEIARGHTPDWSPDGSRIVFANEGKLWSVSPDGGTPEAIFEAYKSWRAWASCSADGSRIATHSLDLIYADRN